MTNTNKFFKRAMSIALSALMLMTASAALATTASAATIDDGALAPVGMPADINDFELNTGKAIKSGTHNMFKLENTADNMATYVVIDAPDTQGNIQLYDSDFNAIGYTNARQTGTGKAIMQVPMSPANGDFYYVDVYQTPDTTAGDFVVYYLDQQQFSILDAVGYEVGDVYTIDAKETLFENMKGEYKEGYSAQGVLTFTVEKDCEYNFHISPDVKCDFSFIVAERDDLSECIFDMDCELEAGDEFTTWTDLEEGETYYLFYTMRFEDAGSAEFFMDAYLEGSKG